MILVVARLYDGLPTLDSVFGNIMGIPRYNFEFWDNEKNNYSQVLSFLIQHGYTIQSIHHVAAPRRDEIDVHVYLVKQDEKSIKGV